jgi:ABC-type multidrug transport system permease subunit
LRMHSSIMWVVDVPRLQGLRERVKVNLRHILTFYYEEASRVAVWWLWSIPFQILQIIFSLLLYKYYALAFGGFSPLYGGNFMAFIISGLMINTYMDASLEVYYQSIAALYHGRMGIGGVHLSRRDYLQLAEISPYTFIFARTSWRYLMETIMFTLYFLIGVLFFGFQASMSADPGLVICIILLSIAACSGIGLISASMYWLIGAYRGTEPIAWFTRLLAPLTAGIYIPREILPRELAILGSLLPQTYAADAIRRTLLMGATLNDVKGNIITLALQASILIPIGIIALKYSLTLERKRATMY